MSDLDQEVRGPVPPASVTKSRLALYMGCLQLWSWLVLVLFLLLAQIGLMIGSLATNRWVTEGYGSDQWFGGLTTCNSCPQPWRNRDYSSLAQEFCSLSDPRFTHYCNVFEDLRDAGGEFLFFELVTIATVIAWMVKILTMLLNKDCLHRVPWSAYTYGLMATFFHWTGIILWGAVTDARFDADCDAMTVADDKPELCGTRGPIIAIVVAVMFPLILILFSFVYYRIGSDPIKKKPEEFERPGRTSTKLNY